MKKLVLAAAALSMIAAPAFAMPACKDAKGKFIKCPPKAAAATVSTGSVTRDAKGKCHVASGPKKGQFTKCP